MSATLTTTLDIPGLGDTEVMVEYQYQPRERELYIDAATAMIGGVETCVWQRLTPTQRYGLDDECIADFYERMENRSYG